MVMIKKSPGLLVRLQRGCVQGSGSCFPPLPVRAPQTVIFKSKGISMPFIYYSHFRYFPHPVHFTYPYRLIFS